MAHLYPVDTTQRGIYQKKVWGNSHALEDVVGPLPSALEGETIGEIFLASTHPDGKSFFTDGTSFDQVISSQVCKKVFGYGVYGYGRFPLLLKILSAQQPLSVQTHYANKVEAWYALSDGAMLYGLTKEGEQCVVSHDGRDVLNTVLHDAKDVAQLARYFNHVTFQAGDAYVIQAGMVHALLEGTVFEPQMNSNLTNRGGDWGRNDPQRPLHLKEFYESLYPFCVTPRSVKRITTDVQHDSRLAYVFATNDFALEELSVDGAYNMTTEPTGFKIGVCVDGMMDITSSSDVYRCTKGSVFVVPSVAETWEHLGKGTILYTSVPHLMKDVIMPLLNKSTAPEDIVQLGGPVPKENDLYIDMKEFGIL